MIKVGLTTTTGHIEMESTSYVQTTDQQHLVLTWKSGEALKLYIDGEMTIPTFLGDIYTRQNVILGGTISGIQDLILGHGSKDVSAGAWAGSIDDIKIYDVALNNNQVNDLYLNGKYDEVLYGTSGSDQFIFDLADISADKPDIVIGFDKDGGDALDFKALISGFDLVTDAISDFIQITTTGMNSIVEVDQDGLGSAYNWRQVAIIDSVTGIENEQNLLNNGNLIVS